jgi:hypothetical protein
MDQLDRMFNRLVQNIRTSFPHLLDRPFEVAQLYQQILPYRLNRQELQLESIDEYELTLMQLLSGERGYLGGDSDMQSALRTELRSPNPDLGAYRAWATATVALEPAAVRALEIKVAVPSPALAVTTAPTSPTAPLAWTARATDPVAVGRPSVALSNGVAAKSLLERESLVGRGLPCRHCSAALPEGREVTFCPYCGQNLRTKYCPACSTELELDWRFCIVCGRQAT